MPNKPRLVLGTWALGGDYYGPQDVQVSKRLIQRAYELGIRDFDTAPVYGKGQAELLLGQVSRGWPDIRIRSKSFLVAPTTLDKNLGKSLKRLGRDSLNQYFLHWPWKNFPIEPAMDFLQEQRERGRIEILGLSNFSQKTIQQQIALGAIHAVQRAYNLFYCHEKTWLQSLGEHQISIQGYSPLAQGLLSGKYLEDFPMDNRRKMIFLHSQNVQKTKSALAHLNEFCLGREWSLKKLSYLWLFHRSPLDEILIGPRTLEQLDEIIAFWSSPQPPPEILDALERIAQPIQAQATNYGDIFGHNPPD